MCRYFDFAYKKSWLVDKQTISQSQIPADEFRRIWQNQQWLWIRCDWQCGWDLLYRFDILNTWRWKSNSSWNNCWRKNVSRWEYYVFKLRTTHNHGAPYHLLSPMPCDTEVEWALYMVTVVELQVDGVCDGKQEFYQTALQSSAVIKRSTSSFSLKTGQYDGIQQHSLSVDWKVLLLKTLNIDVIHGIFWLVAVYDKVTPMLRL